MFFEKYRYVHFPPSNFPTVHIDYEKCKKCKTCVKTCPTSCLQWDEEKKRPIPTSLMKMDPACLGCGNCEAVCPEGAIRLSRDYFVFKGRYKSDPTRPRKLTFPFRKKEDELAELEKSLTEVEKYILKRRSVRLFKDKEVEGELIERILEAGRFAPTAGNGQPFKFVVVTNKKINEEVDKRCAKVLYRIKNLYLSDNIIKKFFIYLLSYISPNKWDQRPITAMERLEQKGGAITFGAPVVIHILKDTRGISRPDIDVGICGQNMVLTAHALGLGTCFIGFIASAVPFAPSVKKILGIKYPYELALSICVGYPKVNYDKFVERGEVPVNFIN